VKKNCCAPTDSGLEPAAQGCQPPIAGFVPAQSGSFPAKSGAFPADSGLKPDGSGFKPDTNGFKPDKSGLKPDSAVLCKNPDFQQIFPDLSILVGRRCSVADGRSNMAGGAAAPPYRIKQKGGDTYG
jgi:hypothetical protein